MDASKPDNLPRFGKLYKLAPELENLRKASLHKVRDLKPRLESLKGLSSSDFGGMAALVPFWVNADNPEGAMPAAPMSDSSEEKKNHREIQEVLSSPKSRSLLHESINELRNNTLAVDQSFRAVVKGLSEAQAAVQIPDQITRLVQLSELWATHHVVHLTLYFFDLESDCRTQTYNELIHNSREVSERARASATGRWC